jgi:flagellar biosynthesis/type III secretory pathway protein FliH
VARDTLLVRLLGAGAVLKQAIAELKELQAEAPERALALPILLRLRLTVPIDPTKQTADDQEFLMDTQDIVETWRREAIQEGVAQGLQQGVAQGLQQGVAQGLKQGVAQGLQQGVAQGLKQGLAHSLVEVYEARFGAMPEDLRAVVEDTDDEPTLVAWLRLAGTRSADEIAAAIRSYRSS